MPIRAGSDGRLPSACLATGLGFAGRSGMSRITRGARIPGGTLALSLYIDINAAPPERLTYIVHVGNAFAEEIVAGRPWASVPELQRIRGIGVSRVAG